MIVQVTVSEAGEVVAIRVIESLGVNGCDEAAVNAVKAVRWQPAKFEGKPVAAQVAMSILFKLK